MWGISQAKFFASDPQVWKIIDGNLYVNYNKKTDKIWEQDIPGVITQADHRWPNLEE